MTAGLIEFRQEFEAQNGMTALHYDIISNVVGRVYKGGASDPDFEDLLQEYVLEVMLERNQLEYVVYNAESFNHLEALIGMNFKMFMERRWRSDASHRLLARAKDLASEETYSWEARPGNDGWFAAMGAEVPYSNHADADIHRASARAATVPHVIADPAGSRDSIKYRNPELLEIMKRLLSDLGGISNQQLLLVFRIILTWDGGRDFLLGEEFDNHEARPEPEHQHLDEVLMSIISQMDQYDLQIMVAKAHGLSDQQIADEVNISRPTVAKRRQQLSATMKSIFDEVLQEHELSWAASRFLELVDRKLGSE